MIIIMLILFTDYQEKGFRGNQRRFMAGIELKFMVPEKGNLFSGYLTNFRKLI